MTAFPTTPLPAPAAAPTPPATLLGRVTSRVYVPKGVLPMLIFALIGGALPLLSFYVDFEESDLVKGLTIATAAVVPALVVLANTCQAWSNIILFFHTGIEVKVIDVALTYAMGTDVDPTGSILAYVGATIIIVHLLPFYLLDNSWFLMLLAYAGVVVNSALCVFIASDLLLLVAFSCLVFLITVLNVIASGCNCPSLLGQIRLAFSSGKWITCVPYASVVS